MEARPRVGLAGIIKNGEGILFGLRKGSHENGTWAFPGGNLEYGETFEACLIREILEETGLILGKIGPVIATTEEIYKHNGLHYITIFLRPEYIGGEPRVLEPKKCVAWKWFHKEHLPKDLMLPVRNFLEAGYKL